ncbi:MAG: putative peptidase [Alphaproteobacteria bacterium]|nr:putative peptidase [Alphaproteobacteria bacterium]
MVSAALAAALLALATFQPGSATSAAAPVETCAGLVPDPGTPGKASRPLLPEDLVRLRDIGPVDPSEQATRLFTLSPDGLQLAFQLRRADPGRNLYCQAMIVMEARAGAPPRIVDSGGELIRATFDFRGKAAFPSGIPLVVTPRWSPDGQWIYFLKQTGGPVQVWRARADGTGSEAVTHSEVDIENFRVAPGGRTLLFESRPALREASDAIEREGLSGFHYDDRYSPVSSSRPFPPAPIPRTAFVQALDSGAVRAASEAETETLRAPPGKDEGEWNSALAPNGRRAWIRPDPTLLSGGSLVAEGPGGAQLACHAPACRGARRPWWYKGAVRFLAREGWARGSTAVYQWVPGAAAPRRLYTSDDVLADCEPSAGALICLREGSLTPRRLEQLDPVTGRRELWFDPNPEFAALRLGRVERLHWRNAFGFETIGDLVCPVGYQPGIRYPLVVVQYDTRGFLRGGTGDEFPIQAFANRGFAVLSVSRPASAADALALTDPDEADRLSLEAFRDRRSIVSSIETGVRIAIDRGIADPGRIGITGLSDGATTVSFALIHDDLFSAAAVANCCFEPSLPFRVGPSAARHFYKAGYPRLTDRAEDFWAEMSLARNGRRIRAPILFQVSDDELMSTLETFTGLRESDLPADMYVFPGERHVIWQPSHRLAIFRRSLDWFDYWLRGIRSSDPRMRAELDHWDRLRAGWTRAPKAQPVPASPSQ